MQNKSIEQLLSEHNNVLRTRERVENIFQMIAPKCHVTVGGSYMLKYWCEAFHDREVSDYDFILYATGDDFIRIREFITMMNTQTGVFGKLMYYECPSIHMGLCNGKNVNVILKEEQYCPCCDFESLEDIINIKREWCRKAIIRDDKPRYKDVEDIATYEEWEAEHNLPF